MEKREENVKAIKSTYEKQLGELKLELKSLKTARKEHAKAMRKNVCNGANIAHNMGGRGGGRVGKGGEGRGGRREEQFVR